MYIIFKDKKLQKNCSDPKRLVQKYGPENGRKLIKRLNEILAADSLGAMIEFRIGGCHLLKENRKGTFGLFLEHPDRLIIEPVWDDETEEDIMDYYKVTTIRVLEVVDYHGK